MTSSDDHIGEAVLIAALKNSDGKAFAEIYRNYARMVFEYARRNLDRREDCEDIVQEIFESLWHRRGELQIQTSLRAYLLGMARYKTVEHFRKGALKKKHIEHFRLFEALYAEAETDLDPDLVQARLNRIIEELPDRCREAVRLRLTENLSNPEIARRMRITTRTVETYMFRAFNSIRAAHTHRSITEG